MPQGICKSVFACDSNGDAKPARDSTAVAIYFAIDDTVRDTATEQLDLKSEIEGVLHVLQRLFLDGTPSAGEAKFRRYYLQLLELTDTGLVGANAAPEVARRALRSLTSELIDDEGGRVKNGHISMLASKALAFSLPCLLGYIGLRFAGGCFVVALAKLAIEPVIASCFLLLWIGCFVGVVLSYGLRSTTMNLDDLINTDSDKLIPSIRLLYAGTLTMLLGMFMLMAEMKIVIGSISSLQIGGNPMFAFLVGVLCGISESTLPATISKKAADLLGNR